MKILKNAVAVSCAGLLLFAPYNYPVSTEMLTAYAADTTYNLAEKSGTITISEGGNHLITGGGIKFTHKIAIGVDCTVTLDNVDIELSDDSSIEIQSGKTVTLILKGTNKVKAWAGIKVKNGASLTIKTEDGDDASGTLEASGYAGIGVQGSVTIESGTITATGDGGAGIGGTNETCDSGSVTINGGIITATSNSGAGIGSGMTPFGSVTINGGTITAKSECGESIGSGVNIYSGLSNACKSVTINDGATINGCEYPPRYTITIPKDVTITPGNATTTNVELSDVHIENGKKISVMLSSTNAKWNGFYLNDGHGNEIEYSIDLSEGSTNNLIYPNYEILSATSEDEDVKTAKLSFSPRTNTLQYAGNYTDTLTFTVSMKNS